MSRTKHTPGPWVIDVPNSNYVAVRVDGVYHYVADCQPWHWSQTKREWPEIDANARLIAAAPDLLTALKALDYWVCDNSDTRESRMAGRKALIAARAAITKAEGQT